MENFNLKLANIETGLNQLLNGIPVGMAYFILKTKVAELEQIYYTQVEKEAEAVQQQHQTKSNKSQTEMEIEKVQGEECQ